MVVTKIKKCNHLHDIDLLSYSQALNFTVNSPILKGKCVSPHKRGMIDLMEPRMTE